MGLIVETIYHPTLDDVELTIDEQSNDEEREPYNIVWLDTAFADLRTPNDLIELGKWLVEQGERIKREYTSKGKKRKNPKK